MTNQDEFSFHLGHNPEDTVVFDLKRFNIKSLILNPYISRAYFLSLITRRSEIEPPRNISLRIMLTHT